MAQTVYYGLDKLEPNKANYVDRINALLELLGGGLGDYTVQLSLAGLSGDVILNADLARRPAVRLTGNPAAAVTLKIPITGRAIPHIVNQCGGSFSTITVKSVGANTSNAAGVPLPTGLAQFIRHDGNSAYAASSVVNPSASSPLSQDLVGFWRFEEASGTRNDSAGVNHLTDNNTVTQAAGKLGFAAQFTSANSEYLSIPDNVALSTGDIDFSVACWLRLDTKTATQAIVGKYNTTGNQREWYLEYFQPTDRFRFTVSQDGSASVAVSATTFGSPTVSTWYLLVARHDSVGNTISLQVNNGTVDSAAHSLGVFNSTAAFAVGAINAGSPLLPLNGRVDALGLWKRLLTPTDGTTLNNSGNGLEYPF